MNNALPLDHSDSMPAEFGSLDSSVAQDVQRLQEFASNRERLFIEFLGRRLRPSPVRDHLIRELVVAFGQRRPISVGDCERLCDGFASRATVRSILSLLEETEAVTLLPDPHDARRTLVRLTRRTVAFYNRVMPSLAAEARRLLP